MTERREEQQKSYPCIRCMRVGTLENKTLPKRTVRCASWRSPPCKQDTAHSSEIMSASDTAEILAILSSCALIAYIMFLAIRIARSRGPRYGPSAENHNNPPIAAAAPDAASSSSLAAAAATATSPPSTSAVPAGNSSSSDPSPSSALPYGFAAADASISFNLPFGGLQPPQLSQVPNGLDD